MSFAPSVLPKRTAEGAKYNLRGTVSVAVTESPGGAALVGPRPMTVSGFDSRSRTAMTAAGSWAWDARKIQAERLSRR